MNRRCVLARARTSYIACVWKDMKARVQIGIYKFPRRFSAFL